jgi:hypothetical protein
MKTTVISKEIQANSVQDQMIETANSSIKLFSDDNGGELSTWMHTFQCHQRMLKKTGVAASHQTLIKVEAILEEFQQLENAATAAAAPERTKEDVLRDALDVETKIKHLIDQHLYTNETDLLAAFIGGQDAMLMPFGDLMILCARLDVYLRIVRLDVKKVQIYLQVERLKSYIAGLLDARESLKAAGVEAVAAA